MPRRGIDYDDPVPDVIALHGPLTHEVAQSLTEQGVGGLQVDPSVPAKALVHLTGVPTLRRLDLSNRNDLADEDLAFLEGMPWLTAVSLARCGRISDKAVSYLKGHRDLEQINLQWTATGDRAVAALAGKRELCRVLLGSKLTDDGVSRLRDFPALVLQSDRDSFLQLSSARTLTDQALEYLGELKGIAALDVHMSVFGSAHYTASGVAHLKEMSSLEELNFYGPLVTDDLLREIARIPRLRSLHAQDMASGDEGFIALGECVTLERVTGRFCSRVTDRGFAAIARLPRLTNLGVGGPRLTDAALAPLAEAAALTELSPFLFGDGAFEHIARIPRLETLVNMYNRATSDAATSHLRNHPRLVKYSAFGTQITDESLRILAGMPRLETVELDNCAGITDDGLRELAKGPRLRRMSVASCLNVKGAWTDAVPPTVEAVWEPASEYAHRYRAETLMDYPNLPMPVDIEGPLGDPPASSLMPALACFGARSVFVREGLRLALLPGIDARWIGAMTREAFDVPLRIELVVRPITELRLLFGAHNQILMFDERGFLKDPAPWFTKLGAQKGHPHQDDRAQRIPDDEWSRIALEIDARERRLFVNGTLRHSWAGEFAGARSRIAIGLRQSELTVQKLTVESLSGR